MMNIIYLAAIITTIALSCFVLGLAAYTFAMRRKSDEKQSRIKPVRQSLNGFLVDYLNGALTIGQLAQKLHDSRDVSLGVLLARASLFLPDEEEKLHAVFRRMGFDQIEIQSLEHPDEDRRALAALRLGYMGRGRAVNGLLRAIQEDTLKVRLAAAQSLSHLHISEASLPILFATAGQDGIPVSKATELLADMGVLAIIPLCDFLETRASMKETSPHILIAACNALGLIGSPRCVESVVRFIAHENSNVRASVARALSGARSNRALNPLLHLSRDRAWEARAQAMRGIEVLQDTPDTLSALTEGTTDASWWVRHNAAHSLSNRGRTGVGALFAVLNESPDIYARDAARQALEEKSFIRPQGVALQ